jgi:hypothetical protein
MTTRKLTSRSAKPGVHVEVVARGADERRRGTIVDSRTFGPLLDGYHRRLLSEGQVIVRIDGATKYLTTQPPSGLKPIEESRRASQTILTDAEGRPLDKPRRADFTSDIAFIHAVHAFNDEVTGIGNKAFDEGFSAAMAKPSMPPGTRRG